MYFDRKKAYLVLEDGSVFPGRLFGADKEISGEVVFNTSMSGYQEILTDPSYHKQLVVMTYTEMGNYGIMEQESESEQVQVSAFIVRHYIEKFSNANASKSLDQFLQENGIPGITGVDTRKLTLKLRDAGSMRGGIFFSQEGALEYLRKQVPLMSGQNLADVVSTSREYSFGSPGSEKIKLAIIDFGIKKNMIRLFEDANFYGSVFPSTTDPDLILSQGYQAVFFSNGPGDPEPVLHGRKIAQEVLNHKIPAFGICLGHQILGLALGARSFKLKFGHRGGNQPVMNTQTNKVEITAQNHGFALDLDSFAGLSKLKVTHINLNDNTVEGFVHEDLPLLSVQYHPEAAPGPHDARYLFDDFKKIIRAQQKSLS